MTILSWGLFAAAGFCWGVSTCLWLARVHPALWDRIISF